MAAIKRLGMRPENEKGGQKPPFFVSFRPVNGAGEGIRTLDPNLGKVVLYP